MYGPTGDSVEIRSMRLLLRPPVRGDADDLFAIYSDERVAFYALPRSTTREEVETSIGNSAFSCDRARFVAVLKDHVISDVVLEIDQGNSVANLGYAVHYDYWGQGIATEAVAAVVDYAFSTLKLAKVYARADPRNVGSVRVMEKLGMQREALLRSHVVRRGECCDRVYYGLLRDEWERGQSEPRSGR